MAALEEDYYTRQVFNPASASAPPSALDGEDDSLDLAGGTDYSAGADETTAEAPLTARDQALAQRPVSRPRLRSERAQALIEQTRQMIAARAAASGGDSTAALRSVSSDPGLLEEYNSNLGDPLTLETTPPPKEEAGWGQIFTRGIQRANEAIVQDKDIAEGKTPRASKTPAAEFEQPLELGDFTTPVTAAKKLWYGLAKSYPAVAAGVAGSVAGGAIGSAVPVVGSTIGAAVGGAAGMGGGSFLMEIGSAYQAEREAFGEGITPEQDQEAWGKAWNKSLVAAGVGAASMGWFSFGKPFSNALKNILTPVVEGAEKAVAGIPLRTAVQAVGQPAISVGGQVTENVVEGKPLDTNLNQAVAGGLANVVPDVAAALGGRVARRVLGGRQGEATPGVSDDQAAALRAAAGEEPPLDLTLDMQQKALPPPSPENRPPLPPAPPGEAASAAMAPDVIAAGAPPGGGGTPLDYGVGRPPGGEPPPPPPAGGPVPPPRPQPFAPEPRPVETAPTRPADFGVGAPEERPPMPPPPVTTPEEFGISRPPEVGEPPPPPPAGSGPPPMPRPQPFPPTERPIGQRPTRPEDFAIDQPATHVEPDDVNPGQFVAKGGDVVIGKGASPEEALADARARRGEPYAEEVPVEPAVGTNEQLVSAGEKVPPAEAAKPEPAASGRDAASETPVEQTLAEQVKAKGEAKQAAKKAASEAKAAEVKAKGEARTKAAKSPTAMTNEEFLETAAGVTKPAEKTLPKKPPAETVTEEGTRTKSGAYVSPGEAAEPQAPRPAVKTQSDLQRDVAIEQTGERRKGLVSEATRRMAEAPTPEEPFHVPENLNTERKAQRIIRHILGGMKIADAVKAFGAKAEGSVGRPRNVESLSSFIREELRTTKTGAADAARDMEMAKAAAKLRKLGPEKIPGEVSPERRAILDELDERLKLSEGVRVNRAKLEDALRQAEAIERGEVKAQSRVAPGSLDDYRRVANEQEARRNLLERARVPDVNEPVADIMRQFGSSKFHTLLDAIIDTPAAQKLTPQLVEVARILKRRTENFEVRDTDLGEGIQGEHELGSGRIDLNMGEFARAGTSPVVTLLHEGLHGSTIRYIHRLFNTLDLTPQELAHKTALGAISREVNDLLARHGSRFTETERWQLGYAASEAPTGGFHEIITKFFTEPEVTAIMSATPPSAQLRSTLTQAGMSGRGVSSLWGAFKNIIRNIFGFSREHDSIMDLVMRPLTEIVDVGARFERAETVRARQEMVRQNNEVLGTRVSARDESSMRRLREATTRTVKDIADRGLIKTTMRGAFQSATTTAIRDFIKGDVPSAVSHLEYLRQITHASEQERVRKVTTHGPNGEARTEPNIDKARRLHQELKTGPDAPEVNKLMTEVTQAEMSVIDPSRNAHLTTDAQRRQQEAFQARFDALDPRAQQTYREVNEYHNEIYRAEREAKVKNLVDIAFGDRSEADKQALREQMRTKEGVLEVLNNPDATPVSRVLGRDWANKKDLVRLIAESQEGGFVDGDYFPSRRHGEYVVSAGEHNKPGYLVQMFETQSSAQVFRDDLIQSGRKDVSQVFIKSRSRPRDLVSVAALSTLDKAMERAGLSGDAAEVMRDMYAGIMIQHGTRLAERTMRREGIAGASVDQARNILGDFLAYTSRIGHLMHGADAARTLYASEKEARDLHKAGSGASEQRVANAQLGVEELRNRMSPGDGDRSADWMGTGTRRLTTLTVLNTLLRPAHFFMQLAGTHAASTSLIAARHGYLSSVGAVNRAYAQLAGTAGGAAGRNAMAAMRQELRAANWDLADMYRRRLSRQGSGIAPDHADLLIDRLNQAGLINHTWIREIQRLAGPQGFGDGKFNMVSRFLDVSSAGEHAIDSMMRVGTAKAAFELEYRKNGGHLNDALDYAMQMAERSQPDYTMHNKARIATVQGSLGRLAPLTTQFRQFGLHMYGVQGNLLAEGVRGAKGSAERAEAFKSIAYLQASHALIWSGIGTSVFGSLPMMAGLGLYDLLNPNDPTQRAHTNREMETASRNWVRDITGSKTAADIFAHGAPMAFGLNVSRSLQFTNMLSPPELNSFNKPDVLSFLAQAITGASGDTAAGLVEGISRVRGGDISKETIAKLLPRIARDPLEAVVWGEQGLKTHKGDLTIVPPEKFSTADLIAKGMGFIPETSSTARDARAAINLRELTHRDITGSIIDRLVKAAPNERKDVLAEITRYNASVDPADRITGQQIQSRLREQARINAMPGQFAMRVPRREYGKIAEITRFAQ